MTGIGVMTKNGLQGMYSSDDMIAALKLKEGETTIVHWGVGGGYVDQGASKFRITSALDGVSKASNSNSTSKSSEWDEVLDEYEKYIDQYIKLYKKAANGDMSAMTEYASMLEKAESLENKLKNAKDGTLTASQVKRMTKIQNKMISAMK